MTATTFRVGRWVVTILDPDAILDWCWCQRGYDGLDHRWGFGFLLALERDSDYMIELAAEYPAVADADPPDCRYCDGLGVSSEVLDAHESATRTEGAAVGCEEPITFEQDVHDGKCRNRTRCGCGEYLTPCSTCVGYRLGSSRGGISSGGRG